VEIAVSAKDKGSWHSSANRLSLTVVYMIISITFAELLSHGQWFLSGLVLPGFFTGAGYSANAETALYFAVNGTIAFFIGICFGQDKREPHGGWKSGFCYSIVLWFFSAIFYAFLAWRTERSQGAASPQGEAAYDASGGSGGFQGIQ
jgi:hypothetical protein